MASTWVFETCQNITKEVSLTNYIECFTYSVLFPHSSVLVLLETGCLIALRAMPRILNGEETADQGKEESKMKPSSRWLYSEIPSP